MDCEARVVVHNPYTKESFGAMHSDDPYATAEETDVAVVVTDHPEYRWIDLERLETAVKRER